MKRSVKIGIAAIVITAGLGAVLMLHRSKPAMAPVQQSRAALTIIVAHPQAFDWPVAIPATGTIEAWQLATISPEVSGIKITAVLVDVGDRVKRGQVLARLADETLKAAFDQQKASVAKAAASLAQAQDDVKRSSLLVDSGALSAQTVANYRTTEATDRAEQALQQATLETQALNLTYTTIIAPTDGVIASRSAAIGAMAQSGTALFTLVNHGRIEWRAAVPENQIGLIGPDARAILTSLQGQTVTGKIRMIAPTVDDASRDGTVYVDVPNDKGLRPGMFVDGRFETGVKSALTVPEAALTVDNGYSYVFKVQENSIVRRSRVETGRRQDGRVEITSGAAATDSVATDGVGFLNDGDTVRIVEGIKP